MKLLTPYAYIISYELLSTADKYEPLFNELKKSYKWSHYLQNTWIVLRTEPLSELGNLLRPLIFNTDRLLIMPAKGPADGWMTADAWEWIQENVPKEW